MRDHFRVSRVMGDEERVKRLDGPFLALHQGAVIVVRSVLSWMRKRIRVGLVSL
jgi:hypothetical protein